VSKNLCFNNAEQKPNLLCNEQRHRQRHLGVCVLCVTPTQPLAMRSLSTHPRALARNTPPVTLHGVVRVGRGPHTSPTIDTFMHVGGGSSDNWRHEGLSGPTRLNHHACLSHHMHGGRAHQPGAHASVLDNISLALDGLNALGFGSPLPVRPTRFHVLFLCTHP